MPKPHQVNNAFPPSSTGRPSSLQQVRIEEINFFSALRDESIGFGAASETLTMSRAQMDLILELVNTEELMDELQERYTAEAYQKIANEMRHMMPDIDYTPIVQSDKGASHVTAMKEHRAQRDAQKAISSRKETGDKLRKQLEKNQKARSQANSKPVPVVTRPIASPVNYESFLVLMRNIQEELSLQEIANGIDPKAVKAHVLSNEAIEGLYQIMTRVYGIDNVTGDTALNEFTFSRFSDGSMNIISNSALYNGMLLRPHDQFQPMKEQGEQQRMFSVTLFSKGSEGVIHAREAMAAPSSAPNPFSMDCKLLGGKK